MRSNRVNFASRASKEKYSDFVLKFKTFNYVRNKYYIFFNFLDMFIEVVMGSFKMLVSIKKNTQMGIFKTNPNNFNRNTLSIMSF